MTALHDMTAGELLANYKTRKLSPVEAVDAVIAHIEKWEPKLKALYAPDFGSARKAAKASEKRWHAGTSLTKPHAWAASQRACSMARQSSTPSASVAQPVALTSVRVNTADSSQQQVRDRTRMRRG